MRHHLETTNMQSFDASTDAKAWGFGSRNSNSGLVPTSRTVTNTVGGSLNVNATIPGTSIGVQGSVNGSRTSTTTFGPRK
jgi:hypothetical protein